MLENHAADHVIGDPAAPYMTYLLGSADMRPDQVVSPVRQSEASPTTYHDRV
jgi:hypothetical protein